jgi:hypothetical protein
MIAQTVTTSARGVDIHGSIVYRADPGTRSFRFILFVPEMATHMNVFFRV